MAETRKANKKPCDWVLVAVIVVLVLIGFIMVYSSSYPDGYYKFNGQQFIFLKKQIFAAILGFGCMIVASFVNYRIYKYLNRGILVLCIGLSLLTLVMGSVFYGAQRWIGVGGMVIQPSEIIKIGSVLYMADYFDKRRKKITKFKDGFLASIVAIGGFCLLVAVQQDLSTAIIIGMSLVIMYFCSGAKMSHIIIIAMLGVLAVVALIIVEPYRLSRMLVFINPFEHMGPGEKGYQQAQSLCALGIGGLFGTGIGNSRQKFFYLPEPYNDFIFAIIGEELGFIGCVIVILLFVVLAWRGVRIAMNSKDFYGSQIAIGIISLVLSQFMIHVLVTTSSMPPTGRSLPFISAGGSGLMFLLASMGILLNISKFSETYRS